MRKSSEQLVLFLQTIELLQDREQESRQVTLATLPDLVTGFCCLDGDSGDAGDMLYEGIEVVHLTKQAAQHMPQRMDLHVENITILRIPVT